MKKIIPVYLLIGYAISLLIILLYYRELNLETFINATFFVGGMYLFVSLSVYVLSSGLFDIVSNSFRRIFSFSKPMSKEEAEEMRSLSDAISIVPAAPILQSGLILIGSMGIGLLFYYL
ncbi:DUF3899 domain-containing protein [Jeotgalibacillus sp. ET6]|uniref:DUF3899 domain-containing protein n=1 Tax=Jeotgalibacillus sp. ET6 TaxID=3037260 RepID=UPI0024182B70|nr:DUF3899 domain-containing protein [Jeotgalibacillus sp. ET6]MDG5472984.1 DUF3899 domain-containing protein [Jeotgalibacillus sp. ET6]